MELKALFRLFSWVCLSGAGVFSTLCPRGYTLQSNACYKIISTPKTWNEARTYCRNDHGDLISIRSESMFQHLLGKVSSYGSMWIGLRDYSTSSVRKFEWTDGRSYVSSAWWLSGEPNDKGGNERCAQYRLKSWNGLNDESCSERCSFICGKGACPDIAHCLKGYQECSHDDNICTRCVGNNVFYKPTSQDRKCEGMCSYNSHYCWPGQCSDELIRGCTCMDGFRLVRVASETSCQPTKPPSIETCHTVMIGQNGEKKRAMSRTSSTKCHDLTDFYGNFQPVTVSSTIFTEYSIDVTSLVKPSFIKESNFGVTDISLKLNIKELSGHQMNFRIQNVLSDTSGSTLAKSTVSKSTNFTVPATGFQLSNGQRLCIQYQTKGGGYLKNKNTIGVASSPVPYTKTVETRELCYIYDIAPPQHCLESGKCSTETLYIPDRVTQSSIVPVQFLGWEDPIPVGGTVQSASGLESFQITVHEVMTSSVPLKVDLKNVYSQKVNDSVSSLTLNLVTDKPKLLCVQLEVKDVADNVKQARRFILVDKNSFIETDESKNFTVVSASPDTKYTWQTHHNPLCLAWKDYFLNRVYLDNPFLEKIEQDHHGLITGDYDQISGLLPITGTENIYGIIQYNVSWVLSNGNSSGSTLVPNFTSQEYCINIGLRDGDTYTLTVKATDIANHTLSENRTLHIDRSVPHINNIWLIKDGYRRLYVHDTTDLSTMQLYFETLDPHSGIKTIEWAFGTSDARMELTIGAISVQTTPQPSCPSNTSSCYCPDVGKCEMYNYVLPLRKLVAENKHEGKHNRNYYFTLKVTNHAMLSNIEHLDVLVDDSPPEKGVVSEGPVGGADTDYTSDDSFTAHWNGFIDHESGIKMYRVALSKTCLDKSEFVNASLKPEMYAFRQVLSSIHAVNFVANFSGKMFTTVVAINNAMEMSEPACSDGITRDITVPMLENVTVSDAKWSESLACHDGSAWLLQSSMTKVRLGNTTSCNARCSRAPSETATVSILPTNIEDFKDEFQPSFLCDTTSVFTPNNHIIYLPHDEIHLSWNIRETGSQIEDFYVGIGVDQAEASSPSLLNYHSTTRHMFFKRRHVGIGSDQTFFIFIKTRNKAGLETITSVGPVLIDETPPLYRNKPAVKVAAGQIVIGWQNDTFYDMEQSEPLHKVYFQFSHAKTAVTPMMEWVKNVSTACLGYSGGCIKYPVKRLQMKDTDLGLDFNAVLHVYNRAGHSTVVNTESFHVPSRYPPGHALVYDTDPASPVKGLIDTDVHSTDNTICAQWKGFKHHENLTVELAVGHSRGSADVLGFTLVTEPGYHCEKSSLFLPGVKYFVSIRATCSGGETISSSNGVQIFPEAFLTSSLNVRIGDDCLNSKPVYTFLLDKQFPNFTISINYSFKLGYRYILRPSNSDAYIGLKEHDGVLDTKTDARFGKYFSILPFVERPRISVYCYSTCYTSDTLSIHECSSSTFFKSRANITLNWGYGTFASPDIYYNLSVLEVAGITTREITDLMTKGTRNGTNTLREELPSSYFKPGKSYSLTISPCVQKTCTRSIQTGTFTIESYPPHGKISTAEVTADGGNCTDIFIRWESFQSESPVVVHKWAIAADMKAIQMITEWQVGEDTNNKFEINKCLHLPVHSRRKMFACVRAFSVSGTKGHTCKKLDIQGLGEYKPDTVYDFDKTNPTWQEIVKVLPSKTSGHTAVLLHDAELDFGISTSRVAGAIAYGNNRNVKWYLMMSQKVPPFCKKDLDCVYQEENMDGYVEVPYDRIRMNQIYYICALSHATEIEREHFTETMEEIRQCSNGFVLDDTPPTSGKVHVSNTGGFITDLSSLFIQWDHFYDNVDIAKLGFVDPIQVYSYALGSRPGGEDIQSFTDVGVVQEVQARNVKAKDGDPLYATVRATDHAGLTATAVSAEFTVDSTPPTCGHVTVNCGNLRTSVCNSFTVPIQLFDFHDAESGIEAFDIIVGSSCGLSNIWSSSGSSEYLEIDLHPQNIHDGYSYCISVKARNRAGLNSPWSHRQFLIDTTPPTGGHVIDGFGESKKDIDFQTDVTHIGAHWKGFEDVHSNIDHYRVGLGLQPYVDDVVAMTNVGLLTVVRWNTSFVPGLMYFTTVTACNQAGLCRTIVSDGVVLDNSPPIRGVVRVGSGISHRKYISRRSSVHIRWFGFEDPQSDIEGFEACLGTSEGKCDILPFFSCLLQSNVIRTGLNLSDHTNYYATVKSYNKVGMSVIQSSDAFRVDSTPPELISSPSFKTDYTTMSGFSTQWDRTLLTIAWEFQDKESPITHNVVTLKTHHDGHTPIELLDVGPVSEVSIQLEKEKWLSNGDRYIAVVTSCNAAGHCSSAESVDLLIDSTPPHLGGFKPPMTWRNFNTSSGVILSEVVLVWYGFHDEESNLDKYFLSVSRTYSGNELSSGIISVYSNITDSSVQAEQQAKVALTEPITPDDILIISIWARNEAGLNSSVARVSVNAIATNSERFGLSTRLGILEIEKHSCDIHFCNKDCTCAVIGQPCIEVNSNASCITLAPGPDKGDTFPDIDVFGGQMGQERTMTSSSACLAAHWHVVNVQKNANIERFEWSIGLLNEPIGEGVFDLKKQIPWNDVGSQNEIVYCLQDNKTLLHNQLYTVYVKVWYSWDTSRIYTSSPILVDLTAPAVKRGAYIKDSDSSCKFDFDYISWMGNITACWKGVFIETQTKITHYMVALGTSPKAGDIYPITTVGLNDSKEINHLKLHHGTRYFVTVTAYNSVGLHTTLSSDGFVVDMDIPVSGVVFNTAKHVSTLYQHSVTEFSLSWHGFQDHFSGIKSYSVAILDQESQGHTNATFIDVGLRTHYTFTRLLLTHGKSYIGLVKARDAAGHVSKVSTSRPKLIDTTSPQAVPCLSYSQIDSLNVSFSGLQNPVGEYKMNRNNVVRVHGTVSEFNPKLALVLNKTAVALPLVTSHDGTFTFEYEFIPDTDGTMNVSLDVNHLNNETVRLQIDVCDDMVKTNASGLQVRQTGPSTFNARVFVLDNESYIYKVQLGIGTTPGGFQVRSLTPVFTTANEILHVTQPHGTRLYFTATTENHAGLRSVFSSQPLVMDKTPPVFTSRPEIRIDSTTLSVANVCIAVTWGVQDTESGVKLCYCSLGYHHGSSELKSLSKTDTLNTCVFGNVSVVHGDVIHATVRCVNHVELMTEETSVPFTISVEKPVSELAKVEFISPDDRSLSDPREQIAGVSDGRMFVQSNLTCLQIQWSGFTDVSGVEQFQYRILDLEKVVKPWTGTGRETMTLVNNRPLQRGDVYTAEVRAANIGGYVSDSASARMVIGRSPALTGKPMTMNSSGTTLRLDWSEVFTQDRDLSCIYDVTVGTREGYNDVMDDVSLSSPHCDVEVKSTVLSPSANEIRMSVTCAYVTGAFKTYRTAFKLP